MGLDIHRFIGEVLEDFRCPVCHDIVEDPISTQCEHIFCKICIDKWLQNKKICPVDRNNLNSSQLCEPSRIFRNFYSKLIIKCEFATNGCKTECKIEELSCHQNECKFNPIVESECENGCEAMLTVNELMEHNCVQYLEDINLAYQELLIESNKQYSEQEKSLVDLQNKLSKQYAEMEESKNNLEKVTVEVSKLNAEIEKCNADIEQVTAIESKQTVLIRDLETSLSTKCDLINVLTKKNESQLELLSKMVEAIQDEAKNEGPDRSKAIFQLKVENFSKLNQSITSPPTFVRKLPWTIHTGPKYDEQGKQFLGLYLKCTETNLKAWSCFATAALRIISQKEGIDNYSRKFWVTEHNYNNKSVNWGWSCFMDWNNILDPEKGYIKNDTIILEAEFSANEPSVDC